MIMMIDNMHSFYLKINRKSKLHSSQGAEKSSTYKMWRLIYVQLDQPTHLFLKSASQPVWFHLSCKSYTYFTKDISQLDLQKMKRICNVLIDVFF